MINDLDTNVKDAQKGDEKALKNLVVAIQNDIYHLSLRMLVDPEHALDATQEILVLVVTKLSTYRHESLFRTWYYRVATNYLLTAKKIKNREMGLTFDIFGADLEQGLVDTNQQSSDDIIMLNELRISCTIAMLLCLDLKHRSAYLLGEILEFDHQEASEILEISKDLYRKRLSRARSELVKFTAQSCGLSNSTAKCSCPRRLPVSLEMGRVSKNDIFHSTPEAPSYSDAVEIAEKFIDDVKVLKLQQATRPYPSPYDFGAHISRILQPNI